MEQVYQQALPHCSLLADVLVMPFHAGQQTSEAVDASIVSLRDRLPGLMHLWDEERGNRVCEIP